MELSNFFSAAEGRLERWRTLHRTAKKPDVLQKTELAAGKLS